MILQQVIVAEASKIGRVPIAFAGGLEPAMLPSKVLRVKDTETQR